MSTRENIRLIARAPLLNELQIRDKNARLVEVNSRLAKHFMSILNEFDKSNIYEHSG